MNNGVDIHHHFHWRATAVAFILFIANSRQGGISGEQLSGSVQTEDSVLRLPRPKDHAVESGSLANEKDQRPHSYKVHWAKWEARVDKAIWSNIPDETMIAGGACVQYAVTPDRHVQITFVRTPDLLFASTIVCVPLCSLRKINNETQPFVASR